MKKVVGRVQYFEQSFCAKEMKTWVRLEAIRSGRFFGRDLVRPASVELRLFSLKVG